MAAGGEGVLIGRPLPGVSLAIVSPVRKVVPVGQAGELLVGGVGVALGYHRRQRETNGKFLRSIALGTESGGGRVIHIPGLEPGRRVVCTGDRVVQLVDDGPLFWLGKMDSEVSSLCAELEGSSPLSSFWAGKVLARRPWTKNRATTSQSSRRMAVCLACCLLDVDTTPLIPTARYCMLGTSCFVRNRDLLVAGEGARCACFAGRGRNSGMQGGQVARRSLCSGF